MSVTSKLIYNTIHTNTITEMEPSSLKFHLVKWYSTLATHLGGFYNSLFPGWTPKQLNQDLWE